MAETRVCDEVLCVGGLDTRGGETLSCTITRARAKCEPRNRALPDPSIGICGKTLTSEKRWSESHGLRVRKSPFGRHVTNFRVWRAEDPSLRKA